MQMCSRMKMEEYWKHFSIRIKAAADVYSVMEDDLSWTERNRCATCYCCCMTSALYKSFNYLTTYFLL